MLRKFTFKNSTIIIFAVNSSTLHNLTSTCGPSQLSADWIPKILSSPNYPFDYIVNTNCSWLIDSSNGSVILELLNFETEENYDFVRIYDGPFNYSSQIANLTGFVSSTAFYSTGRYMRIDFSSDNIFTKPGFQFQYAKHPGKLL